MELTEEQRERIRKNKERALELLRKRQQQQQQQQQIQKTATPSSSLLAEVAGASPSSTNTGTNASISPSNAVAVKCPVSNESERGVCYDDDTNPASKKRPRENNNTNNSEDDHVILEDFEIDASPWVSKKDAMQLYCLPAGTLAVCQVEERPNPRHSSWTPMKLYRRSEIRRRARERYGGLEGLMIERQKRHEKRFQHDWEKSKQVFK